MVLLCKKVKFRKEVLQVSRPESTLPPQGQTPEGWGLTLKDLNSSGVLRQGSVEIQHVGVWTFGGQILEVGLRAGD